MKATSLFAASAPSTADRLGPLLEALRGLGPRHFAAVLVVTLLFGLARGTTVVNVYLQYQSWLPYLTRGPVYAVCLVLGVVIADAYVRRGAPPLKAYATAVVAGAVVAAVAVESLQVVLASNRLGLEATFAMRSAWILYSVLLLVVQGGLGVAVWHEWRAREAASRRLRALELRRAEAERQVQQSRLLALQARVEPELLFAALQRVGELAETARNEDADRLLDALITFLRLLMPGDSRPGDPVATSVERELATAVACLRVHDAMAGARRELALSISADAAPRPMPPMLVLPIARAIARREATARRSLRIHAESVADGLRLVFAGDEGAHEPLLVAADLVELRRRLDEAFGSGAASAVATEDPATLVLHLPWVHEPERTDGTDR